MATIWATEVVEEYVSDENGYSAVFSIKLGEKVYSEYSNEIIKKIKACFEYSNYPEEFKEFFKNKKFSYSVNDLVESNNELYTIVGYKGKNILFALPTYTYPKINTVEKITDGLKYYVDISDIRCLKRGDIDFYITKLYGLLIGNDEKDKEELKKLFNYAEFFTDFSKCSDSFVEVFLFVSS